MSRRIIGQCNTSDFKDIEKLASLVRYGGESPTMNNRRQGAAVMVLRHFQLCGVSFDIALKLKEVLVWEMPNKSLAFEYKLLNPQDLNTLNILQALQPTKIKQKGG